MLVLTLGIELIIAGIEGGKGRSALEKAGADLSSKKADALKTVEHTNKMLETLKAIARQTIGEYGRVHKDYMQYSPLPGEVDLDFSDQDKLDDDTLARVLASQHTTLAQFIGAFEVIKGFRNIEATKPESLSDAKRSSTFENIVDMGLLGTQTVEGLEKLYQLMLLLGDKVTLLEHPEVKPVDSVAPATTVARPMLMAAEAGAMGAAETGSLAVPGIGAIVAGALVVAQAVMSAVEGAKERARLKDAIRKLHKSITDVTPRYENLLRSERDLRSVLLDSLKKLRSYTQLVEKQFSITVLPDAGVTSDGLDGVIAKLTDTSSVSFEALDKAFYESIPFDSLIKVVRDYFSKLYDVYIVFADFDKVASLPKFIADPKKYLKSLYDTGLLPAQITSEGLLEHYYEQYKAILALRADKSGAAVMPMTMVAPRVFSPEVGEEVAAASVGRAGGSEFVLAASARRPPISSLFLGEAAHKRNAHADDLAQDMKSVVTASRRS